MKMVTFEEIKQIKDIIVDVFLFIFFYLNKEKLE
jgi:hypothetical protein